MGWDAADVDGLAAWIYDRADADMADPPDPIDLAGALGIGVEYASGATIGADAVLSRDAGRWIVRLARSASLERARFALGHEIGEWASRERNEETIEALCNAISAAVLLPRPAFVAALRYFGPDLQALARVFRTTETCVGLRIGEVTDRPMLLVSPAEVRARGEEWAWPNEAQIRRQIRSGDAHGLRIRQLADDSRRVWIVAA